ncbi:membrane protein [Bacillus sp. JCM 19045]|nr:membrane protein [Bacillus sp. JCM 19045]
MTTINLSQESNRFIEDLRVYLYSSGKKESEIHEIIEELEVHLFEAEANGKSIEQVVGNSPKLYMESISKEMKTDHRGWLKIIPIIFLGGLSYSILGDLLSQGTLSYSILLLVGLVLNFLLFFFGVAKLPD